MDRVRSRNEIYVPPFPGPGGQSQVSTSGGAQVRWRRDGKELFYIALDGRLTVRALSFPFNQQYDASSDGQRFLMNTVTDEEAAAPSRSF